MDIQRMLETALPILEEAQRYTTNNIANVDTPGFVPQQVDFKASLKAALARNSQRVSLARTNGRHLGSSAGVPRVVVTLSEQATHRTDGNRVNLDYEMTQLSRNAFTSVAEILKNRNRLTRAVLRAR